MLDYSKINIESLPKVFADGAFGALNKEFFYFAFTSGNKVETFATNPSTYKSITEWMVKSLKMYEEKYGEIKQEERQIISPFTLGDLGKK